MQVAWFVYDEIICQYGCSAIIQSDNGLEFVNEIIKQLLEKFQIWHQRVSPYHPQANGMIEHFNRMLGEALSKLEETYDWDKFVRPTLMSYNMSQHSMTRLTLYYLMFGRDLKLLIKEVMSTEKSILDKGIELIYQVPMIRESAKVTIKRAQQRMKHDYPVQQTKEFAIRDQVLYDESPNYHSKLELKWVGP